MKLVKKILGRLNGLTYRQEYLCLASESFENPLHVYLVINGRLAEEITTTHNFVGYSPLLFALESPPEQEMITIAFTAGQRSLNGTFSKKEAVGWLFMKKIGSQSAGGKNISYFEGLKGRHHFLSSFHQFIVQLQNRLYQKKPGNVYLPGNLYKQVQIAYAVPRKISLITIRQDDGYNLFPTDLHGPADDDHYIISLRHDGKACRQVLNTKTLLLSQVHAGLYKTVYSLGKNHMQDMKAKESFPFSKELSAVLHLPLPPSVLYYRELQLQESFIHGIHRLILFKILHQQRFPATPSTLAHIHSVYASWRYNKGLAGNYLFR